MKGKGYNLRKLLAIAMALVIFAAMAPMNFAAAEEAGHNSTVSGTGSGAALLNKYWMSDSKAAKGINDYLLAVTDETSSDYIPVKDRTIAEYDELYAKYTAETLDKAA